MFDSYAREMAERDREHQMRRTQEMRDAEAGIHQVSSRPSAHPVHVRSVICRRSQREVRQRFGVKELKLSSLLSWRLQKRRFGGLSWIATKRRQWLRCVGIRELTRVSSRARRVSRISSIDRVNSNVSSGVIRMSIW